MLVAEVDDVRQEVAALKMGKFRQATNDLNQPWGQCSELKIFSPIKIDDKIADFGSKYR
jgi:hypothetical protein